MSAVFGSDTRTMAGYQIGASGPTKALVTMLSLALVGYNAVHLHDYALVMFVNDETWIVKEYAIRAAAVGLAFVEIIVGGVFVYLYRTNDRMNAPMLLVGFLALVANLASVLILMKYKDGDANVRSVWLCSRNDAIGNVAVMFAALGVWGTATVWPDLAVAGIMAGLFLSSAYQILTQAIAERKAEENSQCELMSDHDHEKDHAH